MAPLRPETLRAMIFDVDKTPYHQSVVRPAIVWRLLKAPITPHGALAARRGPSKTLQPQPTVPNTYGKYRTLRCGSTR